MSETEKVSRRDAFLRGFATMRYALGSAQESETSRYTSVNYPGELYDRFIKEKQDPKQKAQEAIQIGILADNDHLFQVILGDELPIRLHELTPIRSYDNRQILKLGQNATNFIINGSPILRNLDLYQDIGDDVRDWYAKTTTIQRLFEGENAEQLTFRIEDQPFSFTSEGINEAWLAAHLPTPMIINDLTRIFDLAPETGVK